MNMDKRITDELLCRVAGTPGGLKVIIDTGLLPDLARSSIELRAWGDAWLDYGGLRTMSVHFREIVIFQSICNDPELLRGALTKFHGSASRQWLEGLANHPDRIEGVKEGAPFIDWLRKWDKHFLNFAEEQGLLVGASA
jgi:hypothetical protein